VCAPVCGAQALQARENDESEHDHGKATSMTNTEIGRVTSSDGTSIAFDRVGTGPAVVLVDAAGNFRAFSPMPQLAQALSDSFTVFTFDRRGKGASTDTQPYAVDREIDDLQALIDIADGCAFVHGFSSGAILALLAAERGLNIPKLSLLEPPLRVAAAPPPPSTLGGEVAKLIVIGRRGDAYERWLTGIGVPPEMITEMREGPMWPALKATAHTLIYDSLVPGSMPPDRLAAIPTPTLVVASQASNDQLRGWADGVAAALPNAALSFLPGVWHGIAPEQLAPALTQFYNE
jgi:pimeloyl-ACP methyl ester carboxylesterase